jgi:hypothetical protein
VNLIVALFGIIAYVQIRFVGAILSGRNVHYPVVSMIAAAWAVAVFAFPFVAELLNRKLLRDGKIAVGRVIHEETVSAGKATWSAIFYSFADSSNRGFVSGGNDFTNTLAKGAPIIVYYDPANPENNVAMECSRLQVKLPEA